MNIFLKLLIIFVAANTLYSEGFSPCLKLARDLAADVDKANTVFFRKVRPDDAENIRSIYAFYNKNEDSYANPFTYIPSLSDISKRIANFSKKFPFLIAEKTKEFLGFVYVRELTPENLYDDKIREILSHALNDGKKNVILSIYLKPGKTGLGIGRKMVKKMFKALRMQGVSTVYLEIISVNYASLNLFKSFGSRYIGTSYNTGIKKGQPVHFDVVAVDLNPGAAEFRPVSDISLYDILLESD